MSDAHLPGSSRLLSISLTGLDAELIYINATTEPGSTHFQINGLSETHACETRIHVRSALAALGVRLDDHRVVVDFIPSQLGMGGSFDLVIALAVLTSLGVVPEGSLDGIALIGGLSLSGDLRPVRGVLPALLGARDQGTTHAIVPAANAREAPAATGIHVLVAGHLRDIVAHVRDGASLPRASAAPAVKPSSDAPDMSDIRGQYVARRALEIAAAGRHNVLLIGPPGAGKTMLARRLSTLMPRMSEEEVLEVSALYSVAGLLSADRGLVTERPFRAPHHTVSEIGLLGGGAPARPGELSLAHHGVLFLDELAEFRRTPLGAAREAIREGSITLLRAGTRATFPTRPLLVGATAGCPCGFMGDGSRRCSCSAERTRAFSARVREVSAGLFDVHVILTPVDATELTRGASGEASSDVQKRVLAARARQSERMRVGATADSNAALTPRDVERFATPDASGAKVVMRAVERLPGVQRNRLLRVARTVADLEGSEWVRVPHVAEAIELTLPTTLSSVATMTA